MSHDINISIVKKRSARYLKNIQKFVVCIPKSVDEAYIIDKENVESLAEHHSFVGYETQFEQIFYEKDTARTVVM